MWHAVHAKGTLKCMQRVHCSTAWELHESYSVGAAAWELGCGSWGVGAGPITVAVLLLVISFLKEVLLGPDFFYLGHLCYHELL